MFRLVVIHVVLAVASANAISFWGTGLAQPLAASWTAPSAAGAATPLAFSIFNPLVTQVGSVPSIAASDYRGPFSLAPGQPANIQASDGRPLYTPSVNLDRAVHYTARALEGNSRRLQKRSIVPVPLAAVNFAATKVAATNLAAGTVASGLAISLAATPLTLGRSWVGPTPIAAVAIAASAPLGLGVGARVGNIW